MVLEQRRRDWALFSFHYWITMILVCVCCIFIDYQHRSMFRRKITYSLKNKMVKQAIALRRLTTDNDAYTKHMLRMTCYAFRKFCDLLVSRGGLRPAKYVSVEEQVAIFLSVLAHHNKNRTVLFHFRRSGHTISRYFHVVLRCVLRLHRDLLAEPIPIAGGEEDKRWGCFPGCVEALDGTYCFAMVSEEDKPRYSSRKGAIATNVLGACEFNGLFTYALAGWEGSAADGRVLRDAIMRPNGLKVPKGTYYLCDNGYTNCEGFLTPYRGIRYHLKEWGVGPDAPQNFREYFNMKHSQARNVIERTFGVLKKRWSVFRSTTFYPIKFQSRIILACMLIHNFQLKTMPHDMEVQDDLDDFDDTQAGLNDDDEYIDHLESTDQWAAFRDKQ